MKKLVLFCCLLCILSSCSKNCVQPGIGVGFYPFDSTSESIIIVKKYKRGSNFSQLIDSAIYSDSKKFDSSSYYSQYSTDTLYYAYASISTDYDWMFEFPVVGKVHTVSNIGFGNETQSTFLSGFDTKNVYQCYTSTNYYYDGRSTSVAAPGPTNVNSYSGSGSVTIPVTP